MDRRQRSLRKRNIPSSISVRQQAGPPLGHPPLQKTVSQSLHIDTYLLRETGKGKNKSNRKKTDVMDRRQRSLRKRNIPSSISVRQQAGPPLALPLQLQRLSRSR
ncbi:hypothetical protein CEXT_777291 [Caerostris extrusa]|uniref:Uncharacterized protein n=1 Tax=Caerostris extrusa TaxID=172846 RepID=A0AAV4Q472_CAEEX|nr:hypothetical protein CEXT_777291 [Caerostris extrusa]